MSNFISSIFGQVEHPFNVLREYLQSFRGVHKFKAHILSWIDGWLHHKLNKGDDLWVYVVEGELANKIGCCRDTIRRHLHQLCDMGILVRKSYKRWATDNIFAYTINPETLSKFVKQQILRSVVITYQVVSDNLLLELFVGNQTADCMTSDSRLHEDLQPVVRNPTTSINTDLITSQSRSQTTTSVGVEKEVVKEGNSKHYDKKDITSEFSTPPPLPTVMTNDSSTPPTKEELAEAKSKLRKLRLNPDECMRSVVKYWSNWEDFENAIAYTLEVLNSKTRIDSPIALFTAALRDGRKPANQVSRPVEVKPPTPDILSRLRRKFATVLQMPWGDGECWGAYVPNLNCTIPWWEAEKLLT